MGRGDETVRLCVRQTLTDGTKDHGTDHAAMSSNVIADGGPATAVRPMAAPPPAAV
jgi:hypothetical protein